MQFSTPQRPKSDFELTISIFFLLSSVNIHFLSVYTSVTVFFESRHCTRTQIFKDDQYTVLTELLWAWQVSF